MARIKALYPNVYFAAADVRSIAISVPLMAYRQTDRQTDRQTGTLIAMLRTSAAAK